MQMTKIAGVRRRLYAVGNGRLWLRGHHGNNWEAVDTPVDEFERHIEIADVAVGYDDDEYYLWVLTRDGRIFEEELRGWGEAK